MDQTPLTPDFREFLSLLNEYDVRYLLVGGYAVGFHGYVRYTKDLDVWVAIGPDNAAKTAKVIEIFAGTKMDPSKVLSTRTLLQIGAPPTRIEVLTEVDGVDFDACFEQRFTKVVDGLPINVISLTDLRKNKRASNRPQDLADLDNLPME